MLALWIPLWWRHHVRTPAVSAADVEAWRSLPGPSVAESLWELALAWDVWGLRGSDTVQRADEILDGRLSLAGRPAVAMREIDWWADPFRDPTWRLQLQGLRHVRILLAAWHVTGRQAYLSKAGEVISSWITFARTWPFGGGYMWNDEAMADRAVVLSAFWAAYARSALYDPVIGAAVLRSLAQHVGFLTDSRHFTFLTGHGVLQNVALLHVASTVPKLAERAGAVDVAVRRMTEQYRLLVTPEGVWTEHSPGYHLLAVNLLRSASEYLRILGHRVPEEWSSTLARLESSLVQFARPDGSLPPLGDTDELPRAGHGWPREMLAAVNDDGRPRQFIAPCGGYAVLSEYGPSGPSGSRPTRGRQVVMTVSNFPGHGHKHADELSLYLFGDGMTWLTGPGYWPYASPERRYATGWTGANAPAYEDEPEESHRSSELLAYAQAGWGDFVEMERSGPAGFRARRQVAWVRPDWLIVADEVSAPGRGIVLRWLFSPDVVVERGTDEGWSIRPLRRPSARQLRVWVVSERPAAVSVARGAEQPFRGWVYTGSDVRPAPEFEVRPTDQQAFVLTVLDFQSARQTTTAIARPRLIRSGETWSAVFGGGGDRGYRFDRYPSSVKLTLSGPALGSEQPIQPVTCPAEARRSYVSLRTALDAEYGALSLRGAVPLQRYRDVTFLVLGAWLFQELSLVVIRRWASNLAGIVRLASCGLVMSAGILLCLRWWGTNVV